MSIKEEILFKARVLLEEAGIKYVVSLEDNKYFNIEKRGSFDLIKKVSLIREAKIFTNKEEAEKVAKDYNGKVIEFKR